MNPGLDRLDIRNMHRRVKTHDSGYVYHICLTKILQNPNLQYTTICSAIEKEKNPAIKHNNFLNNVVTKYQRQLNK